MQVQCINARAIDEDGIAAEAADRIEAKVSKLVDEPIGVRIKFDRLHHLDKVVAEVKIGHGRVVVASSESTDIHEALDNIAERLATQLKRKGKALRRRSSQTHEKFLEIAS